MRDNRNDEIEKKRLNRLKHFFKWLAAVAFAINQGAQLRDLYLYLQGFTHLTRFEIICLIGLGVCVALLSGVVLKNNIAESIDKRPVDTSFYQRNKSIWKTIIMISSVCLSLLFAVPLILQPNLLPFEGGNVLVAGILAGATFVVMHSMYSSELKIDSEPPENAISADDAVEGESKGNLEDADRMAAIEQGPEDSKKKALKFIK